VFPLRLHDVHLQFAVSATLRPQIQRHGGDFINDRNRETILREIHRFEIRPVAVSYVLHDISALIMLGGIFIHIYLSTIGEPGTFQSMTRGAVSEAWAWTFHPAWYKEITGRDPRKAHEEALARMKSVQKRS
jgi:hypothetical protein